MKEVANFCSFYFGQDVNAPATRARRNQRPQASLAFEGQLSICVPKGESITKATEKTMAEVDFNAAILYIVR
ncbi:hypothetical protein, partial [Winogradskyella ouciana]|uniref:hypothetical protein n=1 Tax=Winogradskyella ouciana TaxID=2608631 RepID=UPI001F22E705